MHQIGKKERISTAIQLAAQRSLARHSTTIQTGRIRLATSISRGQDIVAATIPTDTPQYEFDRSKSRIRVIFTFPDVNTARKILDLSSHPGIGN